MINVKRGMGVNTASRVPITTSDTPRAASRVRPVRSVARQQGEQQAAQGHIESAHELAMQRYRAGLGGYLTVLSAESAVLAQRRQAVDLKAWVLDTRFSLIRAVGGGWAPVAAPATPADKQAASPMVTPVAPPLTQKTPP